MGRLPDMLVRPHQAHAHQGRAKIDYGLLMVMIGSNNDARMQTVHHGTKQGRYVGLFVLMLLQTVIGIKVFIPNKIDNMLA